ncbi:MAG: DUF4332 domain-containing protein [Pseudomonadota bacterium]
MDTHLHTLITAHYCRSTHHYIVMDALKRLTGPHADGWRRLLLHEYKQLLKGAKAPDSEFKDFKNHVLHVGGAVEWGGARGAATDWYNRAVDFLAAERWSAASYALGVLSHYYADPIQPFHTGQTEAEGAVHRALEWSIFKSRPALRDRIDALDPVRIIGGDDTNFVSDMVGAGARVSHAHYETFIDHYDLDAGTKTPEDGLDEALLDATARLLAHAIGGVAHLFERAFADAKVTPKPIMLSLDVAVAEIGKPLRKILSKIQDTSTRKAVEAAYAEYQATGKVIDQLSDDDAAIRALHAREVRKVTLEALDAEIPAPIGRKHERTTPRPAAIEITEPAGASAPAPKLADPMPLIAREAAQPPEQAGPASTDAETAAPAPSTETPDTNASFKPPTRTTGLNEKSDVVDAPSIGKRTARHLRRVHVVTIADLLMADPTSLAAEINLRHITAAAISDWQDQTRLKMALPSLRVHDVQILVGAGIRSVDALRAASAASLFKAATVFARTPAAERIIHDADKPTLDEVDGWISKANAQTG